MSSVLGFASGDTSYETVPVEEGTGGVRRPERRFHYSEIIRDVTIGIADGLTVPFALATGLSSLGNRHIIILGCSVQLTASIIAKSIGVWMTFKAAEHQYWEERTREEIEIKNNLEAEIREMIDVMQPYELDAQALAPVIEKFVNHPEKFADFMMKFDLNLEKPNSARSLQSSLIIGISNFASGLIPLIPYFFIKDCIFGLYISSGITFTCLILFGYIKALYTCPGRAIWGAMHSLFIGLFAAVATYGCVLLTKSHHGIFEII